MIRVLLVDDHALVRMGFRMLLADAAIEVAGEAESGEQALRDYPVLRPDVVVMDLSMPGMGGLDAVRRLLAQTRRRACWCCRRTRTRRIRSACCAPARSAT